MNLLLELFITSIVAELSLAASTVATELSGGSMEVLSA
jgi:hypothetical protein